jgi:hypothetical protein
MDNNHNSYFLFSAFAHLKLSSVSPLFIYLVVVLGIKDVGYISCWQFADDWALHNCTSPTSPLSFSKSIVGLVDKSIDLGSL